MTPISKLLTAAKALINTPEKWIRGTLAQTDKGDPVSFYTKNATCFCIKGAVNRACFNEKLIENVTMCSVFLDKALNNSKTDIVSFNDDIDTTHNDVIILFNKAIQLAKKNVR